jgi:sugar fermentation stimulation protein A
MNLLLPLPNLVRARLLKRYKRFLADVRLEDGTETTVHCPNPGRMSSILPEAETIYLTDLRNQPGKRKLGFRWELAQVEESLVMVNTQLANKVAAVLLEQTEAREHLELPASAELKSEVSLPDRRSRFDFGLTTTDGQNRYIEVKQVSLRAQDEASTRWAAFPDAVTARGKKHLEELTDLSRAGTSAMLLYIVGRHDVDAVRPAYEVDPAYAQAVGRAVEAGVAMHACRVKAQLDGLYFDGWIPVIGRPDDQNCLDHSAGHRSTTTLV